MKLLQLTNCQKLCKVHNVFDQSKEDENVMLSHVKCSCCGKRLYPDSVTSDHVFYSSESYIHSTAAGDIILCTMCNRDSEDYYINQVNKRKMATFATLNHNMRHVQRYLLFNIVLEVLPADNQKYSHYNLMRQVFSVGGNQW